MVYFDSAAAAQPDEENIKFFANALAENFANQEAAHGSGYKLRKKISEAGERLSFALTGTPDRQVIWCSGGTSAFNILSNCLSGISRAVTSQLEHPALLAAVRRIDPGFSVFAPDPANGKLIPSVGDWDLAAFHLVQSETGALQEPETLFEAAPGAVHVLDAVQAAGKIKLRTGNAHIIIISGNKFGSPGCAALLIDPKWSGCERFLRQAEIMRNKLYLSDRILPAAILTCAFAAEKQTEHETLRKNFEKTASLNQMIRSRAPGLGLKPLLPPEHTSPYILHLLAKGFQGGVLVRMMSEEGVMISSGSACASETRTPSPAMTALGLKKDLAFSGLRISFGFDSSADEVNFLLSSLEKVLKKY